MKLNHSLLSILILAALFHAFGQTEAPRPYLIETVAGSNFAGDGGPALSAFLSDAEGVAVDQPGNIYIADANDHRIRKINPAGFISTVAGTGLPGFSGDAGPAASAQLNTPYGVATDNAGNLYIADLGNNRIRKVAPNGTITTIAGGGNGGDGIDALATQLAAPRNIVLDNSGNLYIAEFEGHRIRKLRPDGAITTFMGTGVPGFGGDGAAAISTPLNHPAGIAIDRSGALYVADSSNHRIRQVYNGYVSTVLGVGSPGDATPNHLNTPTAVAVDNGGNLFVADSGNGRIRRLAATGVITTWGIGPGGARDVTRDVALDAMGNLYVAGKDKIVKMASEISRTVVVGDGSFTSGDGGKATLARLATPAGVAQDGAGNLYIADESARRIRKVTPAGTINTVLTMPFYSPRAIAADAAGNVYIASADNHTVQKLAPNGLTTIIAGVGFASIPSDGPANRSALSSPSGVAVDADGAIYIADSGNHRIRKVTPSGVIGTVAGTGERGFRGDGGPAAAASLNFPRGVSVDAAGNLWIADSGNHRVRKINPAGVISTVAGDGTEGELNLPRSAVADSAGNVFISDTGNHRIRLANPQSRLRTVAGAGAPGFGGDGGAALESRLNTPMGILVDIVGSVWIADSGNGRVRKLSPGGIASPIEQPPALSQVSVLNAASLSVGPLAPGEIVSIFGSGMGPADGLAARPAPSGYVEALLGETKVLFDGTPAALFYVQETQINLQVPYTVLGQPSTQLEVYYKGTLKGRAVAAVANAAPALFTVAGGSGQAIVVNPDGTLNSDTTAALRGSIVTLYATGEGQTLPAGVNGRTATEPFPVPVLPLILKIDGSRADVLFAGAAPGFLGLLQINARVPYGFVRTGIVPVSLQIGTAESQTGVTMAIR